MVGGWDRRNSIKLPGHSNVRPTGLHKRGRKGRRGLLHSFSLRAFEWCVDTRSNWVGNVQSDTFWASDLSSCLSSWAGKASSIHSFVFKESVLVEQRSFLWVIGSCSEAVNQTRDWSSWLIDCTLWSKVPLVAGDQISHEKMLYSSWMNKAILAFLREDRGNGLVLDDSYPAVFLLLCQDVPLLISICRKNWSSSKGLARKVPDCSSYFLYETWQSVGTNDFFSGWGENWSSETMLMMLSWRTESGFVFSLLTLL